MMLRTVVVISVLVCSALGDAENANQSAICEVQFNGTASGKGLLLRSFDGSWYCAYRGIRYAKPPLGDLRFRNSILREPRRQRNYTTYGGRCPQYRTLSIGERMEGQEDCLFLNVYTPRTSNSTAEQSYPVLVFVHGGSYVIGWDERDINGVDLHVENGIVVVTFNYRLYALGFLKYDEYNITGNYGLKDQTNLLRWVQRYIGYFGGDPNQVTLAGHSAGAGAVSQHLYLDQSKDLFQRMIVLSGSLLAPWSFLYDSSACIQRYLNDLPAKSLEELRSMDVREFFPTPSYYDYSVTLTGMKISCMIPVLESEQEQHDNFTVRLPQEAILQAPVTQVPILISDTAREFSGAFEEAFDEFVLGENWPNHANETISGWVNASAYRFAEQLVAAGKVNSSAEVPRALANTANMHYPTFRLAKELTRTLDPTIPVYLQRFEFDGKFGKFKNFYYDFWEYFPAGAMHGDDLGYMFSPYNLNDALKRPEDFGNEWKVHRATVELMVNFIKHGNPTPTTSKLSNISWPAMNEKEAPNQLLNIDESFEVRPITPDVYMQYWEKVYDCLYYERCEALKSEFGL